MTMNTIQIIMQRAHALLPAASSEDPNAYDEAMDALEHEVRRALGAPVADAVDHYAGLPFQAVREGGMFTPALVDHQPVTPNMVQMLDDIQAAVTTIADMPVVLNDALPPGQFSIVWPRRQGKTQAAAMIEPEDLAAAGVMMMGRDRV